MLYLLHFSFKSWFQCEIAMCKLLPDPTLTLSFRLQNHPQPLQKVVGKLTHKCASPERRYQMKKMLFPNGDHGGRCFQSQFSGFGLFWGLNQAYNCIFGGYVIKGICSQDIFRGIEKLSFFSLQAFPSYRPLKKVWVDWPNWVIGLKKVFLNSVFSHS